MTTIAAPGTLVDQVRARAERAQRRRQWLKIGLGAGFPIALILIWELSAWADLVDRRFFPPPSQIVLSAAALLADAHERSVLGADLLASGYRILVSYILGSLLGTVTGIAMGLCLPLRYALGPLISAIYPTPKLAIFPLVIVIFGLDDGSKIALMTIGVFFMSCVSTLSGVIHANPIHRDVTRAFRVPAWTRWTKVVVPGALPSIVTGLKLGLGQALILVVSTEMVSGQDGIGHFIWDSWQVLNIPRMFVGLVIVALSGGAAMLFGELLERKLTPWTTH
jgi:ABC-type nitrate/sulfonate/bicarbonate transport system permease component